MRTSSLSFLLYSLSLVAVISGQSTAVTNGGDITTSDTNVPTTTSDPTISSSSSESTSSTTSEPTTSTTSSTTSRPTTTSEPTTSVESTTTSSTTSKGHTTDAPTTSSDHTTKVPVKTITTIHTISGTPIQTTMTSSATDASATESPGLNGESKDEGSSGLGPEQKKIVIGVVVGVGGAIILGAIAVVAWRIRARRRAALDNDDSADLMSGTALGTGAREKAPSPNSGTPFRSTLDQYHNPGPVNAASNF
ncbi:hypothetical protein FE257_005080 [Aspergillus nanangensis]|uniref:Mid2 domain-containing protein n=1 Tax=Aspergillus nanangensis TaxID=2582783 RepID=A0AAD4CR40_ASPNN|nr:hypothetical protein FE257_005080 [Aspergillus nanangensis]